LSLFIANVLIEIDLQVHFKNLILDYKK